jgi:transposase
MGDSLFIFPKKKRGKGQPPVARRNVLNSILYILITGCRWCDLPKGTQWGARSTSHRWFYKWKEDGTLERIKQGMLSIAQLNEMIDWESSSVDGSFSSGKGGGQEVEYGYKGKGVTIHSLVDRNGSPLAISVTSAKESEREQVLPLLESIHIQTGEVGRPKHNPKNLATDKGYDSKDLRQALRKKGIRPEIPKRIWNNRKQPKGRKLHKKVERYVVERTFSWYQRKFRRLVVRWERKSNLFEAFVDLGFIMIWLDKILLG